MVPSRELDIQETFNLTGTKTLHMPVSVLPNAILIRFSGFLVLREGVSYFNLLPRAAIKKGPHSTLAFLVCLRFAKIQIKQTQSFPTAGGEYLLELQVFILG